MEIPQSLLNQIEEGNVCLFLGAGASIGAMHPSGAKVPTGNQLSVALARKFLNETYASEPLVSVSELAISQTDLFSVQKYIHDLLSPFKAAPFHKVIPTFRWKSIYTTNYDLIIEDAYEQVKDKVQELSPVVRNTREQLIFKTENSIPYYKLHGCLRSINEIDLPLILTPEQYITHQKNRERLFSKLIEETFNYTFLFIGYSFADSDIRSILHLLEKEKEGRPRFYMVGPGIKEFEERYWEGKKITSIKTTGEDFFNALDNKISKNVRVLGKLREAVEHPIYKKFAVSVKDLQPTERFLKFINNDIDFIHPALSAPYTEAKQFYRGYFENWDPIIRNLDVERTIKDGILSELFLDDYYSDDTEGQYLFVLKGYAGSGKSVLLKRVAWDAAVDFDKFCIVVRNNSPVRYENIAELHNHVKSRIYLFIDNALSSEDDISKVMQKAKKDKIPISIIVAERVNIWNNSDNALSPYLNTSFLVEYLNDREIEHLVDLLERHNSLGYLEKKSRDERINALTGPAHRELLVALYEATNGKPFREIVKDEYDKISNDTAKSLYLTVCILHRLGSVARAGLISRVHGVNFNRFKSELFKPLEFIVFDRRDYRINDYVYQSRHPHIADIVFETVLTNTQERYDEYVRIITYLDIDYDSDRNAFLSMTNAKKLMEIFPDRNMIRNLFVIAKRRNPDNAKLLQQESIFELETGDFAKAETLIKEANRLSNEEDPIILHSFAELEYKKAEKAKLRIEKESYLKEAISISEALIKRFSPSPHTYHTILKALLLKLELAISRDDAPTVERSIKDVERKFREAKQFYPYQEFILEAESRFNGIIKNLPEALELLKKAFSINKASPFIASRLANFYDETGDIEGAKNVLKEALKHLSGDKDLNYEYGRLLIKQNPSDLVEVLYYLRRAFTEGDNRYQAQFWYARSLYLSNDIEKARKIFKSLNSISLDPEIRSKPNGVVLENGKPKVFEGVVQTVETSYGFIKRNIYGDDIFFYRYGNNYPWELFKSRPVVTFNLAFSYRGPVAINIKRK